jgi:hypothetical protein
MADLSKFEKMLELLINEDREAAEELFHEIVVEKSRDIYESLLEDEDEEVDESDDEEVDESDDDDLDESDDEEVDESDDDLDEGFDLDEFEVEADPMDMGGDPTDDMMADLGMDDGEEGDDMDMDDEGGDTDDRIEDLEDALEDLKAEFEKMMSGDDGDDDMDMDDEGDDMDMDDEGDDMDMDDEGDDEEEKESYAFEAKKADKKDAKKEKKTAGEEMREYVEKINGGFGAKIGGDNGVNNKSSVAGKNDMGGTTANIAKSGTEAGVEANKGNLKGSALSNQTPKDMNTKNVNVVGAKGATKMSNQPGHGAEKKGKPETADKSAGSMLNGAPKRAK